VGSIFGSVAGTLIVASLPIANTFKIALALIVILLIAGLFKKSTAKNDRPKIKIRENLNFIKDIRTYLSIKELREVTLLDIAMSFHHPAMTVFIPLFIVQELKLNVKYAGIFTIGLIIGHLFQFAFGYACEVFTTRKVIRRSVLIFAIGLILLAFVQNTGTLIAVSLILGFSGSAWNTSVLCYLAEVGEKRNQGGLILGSYASVAYMSVFVSFLFSGWFVQQYNFRPIFILYGLIAIISLMLTKLIPEKIAQ
jgi:MFS family permease